MTLGEDEERSLEGFLRMEGEGLGRGGWPQREAGWRGVGREVGRFDAGDRDCLHAVAHLEKEGMRKTA